MYTPSVSPADLLLRERIVLSETVFVEIRVWRVSLPVRGSAHDLKYSLALIAARTCVLRYDNEAGKGDHRHLPDGSEEPYSFRDAAKLVADFWKDVDAWMTSTAP